MTTETKDEVTSINVTAALLEGNPADSGKILTVAKCHSSNHLAVLHLAITPGSYATRIYCRPSGASTDYRILAGFEWSVPQGLPGTSELFLRALNTEKVSRSMASAPTQIAWARSGRDFDRIHTLARNGDEWDAKRLPVTDLLAKSLDKDKLKITIAKDEHAWPAPSTFSSPYPLHVHRHLGLICTRNGRERRSPVELFTSANLLIGNSAIAADKADNVRIVEFETPAAILCSNSLATAPATYRSAYFDLLSTGGGNASTLRLNFRFVGAPKGGNLKIWLRGPKEKAATDDTPELLAWDTTILAEAVGLVIELSNGRPTATWLLVDGTTVAENKAPVFNGNIADLARPGFVLALEHQEPEFWTDVSLLHSPQAGDGQAARFEFGWLFSNTEPMAPADAVKPSSLGTMVEAQARIVSVSPPDQGNETGLTSGGLTMAFWTVICKGVVGDTQGKAFGVTLDTDTKKWTAGGQSVDLFLDDKSGEFKIILIPENGLQIWNSAGIEQAFFRAMNGNTAVGATGDGRAKKALITWTLDSK